MGKQAPSVPTSGVLGLHNKVWSKVATSKVAKSRVSPVEVSILRKMEGLHSFEMVAPCERHALNATEGPAVLDVSM